jgi:hypothetical protein
MEGDRQDGAGQAKDAAAEAGGAPAGKPEEISRSAREKIARAISERFLPEIIKRGVESGLEAITNPEGGLKRVIPDLKLRREMADYIVRQVEETKNAALRVIAGEVRAFLETTNLEEALKRVLTAIAFEVTMNVRFARTDEGGIAPRVTTKAARVRAARPKASRKKRASRNA